ncbi:MAG: hypothetical protein KGO51_16475 [Alphaproteobacteria bacterium]|nr:hypothetical protein [Alphaproteobacteria bacterium]
MSPTQGPREDPGRQALACIDKALAAKPQRDGHALTEATKFACEFRDELIAAASGDGDEERRNLEHANAVISAITAVHFPLGPAPWPELEGARGWLQKLLDASGADEVSGRDRGA